MIRKYTLVEADLPDEALLELSERLEVGLDCEMMGLSPFRDRLCTVQISSDRSTCYIVQVDEKRGARNLKSLMEDEKILKIFHFARMDCFFLKKRLGIQVKNIYCTKIASRLVRTYTDRHGLKELVRELIGEPMDKTNQSSDWGRPQLSPEQLSYAADDVKYLFKLKKILSEMLRREERYELAQQCFGHIPLLVELDSLAYDNIFEH